MIIGLTGKKGSGKSTVADYLNKYNFTEYALAGPLKKIALIFGFSEVDIYGSQVDKSNVNINMGISGREFLQKFGTEICRDYLPKVLPNMVLGDHGVIWIKLMEDFIEKNIDNDIVISDIRFIDEAEAVKKYVNSITIKIIRPGIENSSHSSETSVDSIDADFTILNDGDLNDLYKKIDDLLINYKIIF